VCKGNPFVRHGKKKAGYPSSKGDCNNLQYAFVKAY
jgi:hypothetical protein